MRCWDISEEVVASCSLQHLQKHKRRPVDWTPFRCRLLTKSATQTVLEVFKGECACTRLLEVALEFGPIPWFGPTPWFGPNYSVPVLPLVRPKTFNAGLLRLLKRFDVLLESVRIFALSLYL
jgi:hypothetical protein